MYRYVRDNPISGFDPSGMTDYNQQYTLAQLYIAYYEATDGRMQGLLNIFNNSTGKYDFGWNDHK